MSGSYFRLFLSAIVLHVLKLFEAFWSKNFGVEILGPVFHFKNFFFHRIVLRSILHHSTVPKMYQDSHCGSN
jgi:hypothetical protein